MKKITIWSVIFISTALILSSSVLAGGGDFSWGNQSNKWTAHSIYASRHHHSSSYSSAHGNRCHHRYQYFPSVCVYHEAMRGRYFFLHEHEWRTAVSLPIDLRMQLGDYVNIDMQSDKPFIYNEQHRKQYPSGRGKNAMKENGRTWAEK